MNSVEYAIQVPKEHTPTHVGGVPYPENACYKWHHVEIWNQSQSVYIEPIYVYG
jgi:hypothetical protein